MSIEHLKYPIGKHVSEVFTKSRKEIAIGTISDFPALMRESTVDLSDEDLDSPYRPGGWTKRQVVHHCADSHINAYCRFKLALTEESPTIKSYDEGAWAELPDSKSDIEVSLKILESIHERWVNVLENMTSEDFDKVYYHPEKNAESSLGENLLHYKWHCLHHLGHMAI